jgi:WD40 repeat protein
MSVHTEELAKLKAHRWQVSCLEFRADGFRLATGGWDKEVRVWDMVNLQVVTTLKGVHKVPITSLCWKGGRGEVLCTGSADHTVALWNAEDGVHLQTLTEHTGWVLGTDFSSSGSLLATASWDKSIGIWDANTGQNINKYSEHSGGVWSVAFHPHSSTVLCSASEDGSVKVWDLREGKVTHDLMSGHSAAVYCARWSPDGTMIASGSADTKVSSTLSALIIKYRGISRNWGPAES